MTEAEQAAADAIAKVTKGASLTEWAAVWSAVDRCIKTGLPFTAENVISEMGEHYARLREPRLLGPALRGAHREGRIIALGYVKGTRKASHGRPVMRWVKDPPAKGSGV